MAIPLPGVKIPGIDDYSFINELYPQKLLPYIQLMGRAKRPLVYAWKKRSSRGYAKHVRKLKAQGRWKEPVRSISWGQTQVFHRRELIAQRSPS